MSSRPSYSVLQAQQEWSLRDQRQWSGEAISDLTAVRLFSKCSYITSSYSGLTAISPNCHTIHPNASHAKGSRSYLLFSDTWQVSKDELSCCSQQLLLFQMPACMTLYVKGSAHSLQLSFASKEAMGQREPWIPIQMLVLIMVNTLHAKRSQHVFLV